ncbi:MAG: phage tail tube protein [Acidaminococcaceae bacterium]
MGYTLPSNPNQNAACVGKDFLLYVNNGTAEVPVWTLIGGQRGASLNRSADEINTSDKTSDGWSSSRPGLRKWSIDLESLVMLTNEGMNILEQAFMESAQINVRLLYPDGSAQTGWGGITDFGMETPHDGEATLKGTVSGNGALSARTPSISPLTAIMSLAAASDKVFNILPTSTTVSSVKNGATALTVTTNYTYSTGALTIKSTYLSGLAAGNYTLAITTGDGAVLNVLVTITA